jgi:cellulose synthase/poly-beta-1,6-N-acetylglucosamine synthase-like glycosyltransferase
VAAHQHDHSRATTRENIIEETIRSVLLQGYPNSGILVIIDGGSTDETVEIIRKYEPWLSGWVSEKDARVSPMRSTRVSRRMQRRYFQLDLQR